MKKRILSFVMALLTAISLLPFHTLAEQTKNCPYCDYTLAEDGTLIHSLACNAEYAYDGTGDVGKYVQLIPEVAAEGVYVSADPEEDREGIPFYDYEFGENTVMRITGWYWDAGTTALWYRVELYSGTFPESTEDYAWPETPWIMQDYTDETYDWPAVLEFVTVEPPVGDACDICGQSGCTRIHFYCERCQAYDCGLSHLYCGLCEKYDCGVAHVWCGRCGVYDCGQTHEPLYPLVTEPVIPEAPALTEGAEVTVVDGGGANVTGGVRLSWGEKRSLSAWSDLDDADGVSYRWQICYDMANDLWVDIQGQTGKGILISQAIVEGILDLQGAAAVRCVVTAGEESRTSPAIPVGMEGESSSGSSSTGGEDLQKVYVVVQYEYSDGRTAAAPHIAELTPGAKYKDTFDLNTIPGYAPVLENESSFGGSVTLTDGKLTIDYAAGELTEEYTVIKVIYVPAYVSYTVIHYRQNVDNDNYTEHERETVSTTHKTGEVIADAHKSYDGFYNLLYETPAAAADGSTVVEVYYDRYYYLMKFELGGGYGVEPVYARYGTDISDIGVPTRPGYTFVGWSLDGVTAVDVPDTMPAENRTYTALWTPGDPVNYTVVYWKENADDNNYSYWTQQSFQATPGTKVSGSNSVAPYVDDEAYFTYNDLLTDKDVVIEGDGSTIINVYYNRNYYTLVFYYDGDCNIEEHTHGTDCSRDLICGENGHVHSSECVRILECTKEVHAHTNECTPLCGLPIHTAHTQECLVCTKELHAAHTMDDGCYTLNCKHTHSMTCYAWRTPDRSNVNNSHLRAIEDIGDGEPQSGYIYGVRQGTYGSITYYFYFNGTWYDGRNIDEGSQVGSGSYTSGWNTYNAYKYEATASRCTHECSYSNNSDDSCYELTCTLPIHPEHTEVEGCYSDVLHVQHTDACYDHTSHAHDEDCYTYKCGLEEHTHVEACYRECTKYEHTHGNSCRYGSGNTSNYEIYRVITAKYEASIGKQWPTADDIDGFAYWTGAGANQSSKVMTMTSDYCNSNGIKLLANYNSTKYTLNYWFEHFDQSVEADGVTYKERNGVIYKWSEDYSQTAYYGNTNSWSYKTISGMEGVASSATKESGNVFNLYYKRERQTLKFHNVNAVTKTVTNIMFEQPLKDYTDGNGNLLREYVPDEPENAFEPGTRVFEGWYTTAECLEGTKVDFNTLTMPNNELTLYAKWVPVTRTVRFYLSKDSMTAGNTVPEEMATRWNAKYGTTIPEDHPYKEFDDRIVQNGSYLPKLSDPGVAEGYKDVHPYNGYEFLGWFYINEDGDEAAFDPANMPVTQDLNLYAKWSSNKLCKYNVYFALDANGDGVADLGTDGKPIYVADPISGNGLAGHTYTFTAKGGDELYDPEGDVNYREGYFPHTGSHSITVDIQDENGTGANSFTFLYQQKPNIVYTVHYLEKGTNNVLHDPKTVSSPNVVVTENFVPVRGYMPDEYQKSLILTSGSTNNEIIFWYEKDEVNALYVVNYYIQELDDNLEPAGWTRYGAPLQNTGKIGDSITVGAIDIDGFTLSKTDTDQYNVKDGKNGATGEELPSKTISELTADGKLTGKLTANGMELNFYYTRNLYPYEFRYMLQGTATQLAPPEYGMAGYDQTVTEAAKEIKKDLDGDGVMEDYRLYDPTETTKSIHIRQDGAPLNADTEVKQGDAKINVATFYYVRCTQTMKVTKTVVNNSAYDAPDPNQEFIIEVLIHSTSGYHQTSYDYSKSDGTSGTLSPETARPNVLRFTLKHGETITIDGLPTAEYTVSEQDLPRGYYATYTPQQTNKLTVDAPLGVTVTNTYDPAVLEITKKVDVVEDGNTPEVENFAFTIKVPAGVTGSYDYTVEGVKHTETVADGKLTFTLKNGQTARFENVPVGNYTVEEEDYSARGYKSSFVVNGEQKGEGHSVGVQVARGETRTVECINHFPVGHLQIEKTVTKEFFGTEWDGDTFTFTVERTTADRPLIDGNRYDVYEGETKVDTAIVEDGKLQVTITFNKTDAAKLDEKSEKDASVIRTIEIRNLPAGTYKVTEAADADYVQTPNGLIVSGLEIPAEKAPVAQFANELIRPKGDLSLSKELVAADGYTGELPQDTEFSFTFEATLLPPPDGEYAVEYKDKNGNAVPSTPTTVKMEDGKFTIQIKAGQTVTIKNLPIDTYRITEATVPRMANAFYHNGSTDPAEIEKDSAGNLCTQIPVPAGETAAVCCVNTYPVDNAELTIIHKSAEPGQIFVYEVKNTTTNEIITVTVTAGNDGYGSATIVDLPFGSYTVTQKNDWSWRYREEASDDVKTVVHSSGDTTVEFAQTWIDYWLGGCSALLKNIFRGG